MYKPGGGGQCCLNAYSLRELALAGWATAGLPSQVLYGQGGAFVVVLFFHTANPCSQEGLPALGY